MGIAIGHERDGPAGVSEPVLNRKDCTKMDYKKSKF